MGKKEGYLIVSLVWVVFSIFGAIPFVMSGSTLSFTDAFFETMSGFTTTGASILNDIESLPKGMDRRDGNDCYVTCHITYAGNSWYGIVCC